MTREEQMWQAVKQEHGKISRREALIALTAMEWSDKTMIDRACKLLKAVGVLTDDDSIKGFIKAMEE